MQYTTKLNSNYHWHKQINLQFSDLKNDLYRRKTRDKEPLNSHVAGLNTICIPSGIPFKVVSVKWNTIPLLAVRLWG